MAANAYGTWLDLAIAIGIGQVKPNDMETFLFLSGAHFILYSTSSERNSNNLEIQRHSSLGNNTEQKCFPSVNSWKDCVSNSAVKVLSIFYFRRLLIQLSEFNT